jgi:hypothetical protein
LAGLFDTSLATASEGSRLSPRTIRFYALGASLAWHSEPGLEGLRLGTAFRMIFTNESIEADESPRFAPVADVFLGYKSISEGGFTFLLDGGVGAYKTELFFSFVRIGLGYSF